MHGPLQVGRRPQEELSVVCVHRAGERTTATQEHPGREGGLRHPPEPRHGGVWAHGGVCQGWDGPKGLGERGQGLPSLLSLPRSVPYPTVRQHPEPLPPPLLRPYPTATRWERQSPQLLRGQRQGRHCPWGLQTRTLIPGALLERLPAPGAQPCKPESLTLGPPPACSGSPSGRLQGRGQGWGAEAW